MQIQIDVNSDALVTHVARLERISKKAMPKAVRGTLNSLAFDVKERTFLTESKRDFTNRTKTFFKSNSGVDKARGKDIEAMAATVGMFANRKETESAINNMDAQMRGGTIRDREMVPYDTARVKNSDSRTVRGKNRLKKNESKLGKIVHVDRMKGNKGQKFIQAVLEAGEGNVVRTERSLIKVKGIGGRTSRRWDFDLVGLWYIRHDDTFKIKQPTNTMSDAAIKSMRKEQEIFRKEAKRQLSFIK